MSDRSGNWPAIPYSEWKETCTGLHLWTQIVGKYRVAHAPWDNHSWHVTLYVTSRGLTTGPIFDGDAPITLTFDFRDHKLVGETPDMRQSFALEPMSVAEFHKRTGDLISALGGKMAIHGAPNEVSDAVPFAKDTEERAYDGDAVRRFHRAMLSITKVFDKFSTSFLGKISPVHFFWGSFDLAVTRFSGRKAPLHPGGVPNLPDDVAQEAYSHEVSSAGFWPGGSGADEAMFYSYAYPAPAGFSDRELSPEAARFDDDLQEFVLPYEAVRTGTDPEGDLLAFLQSTYEAAAEGGVWDREALECDFGRPAVPRTVHE